jgi:ABC-type glycerol-3-phosphate transport system substrate-binding protein
MNNNGIRPFQVALLAGSVLMFFTAIGFLALYEPEENPDDIRFSETIDIWGTFNKQDMDDILRELAKDDDRLKDVKYEALSEDVFVEEFVDALAEGRGPDLVILPHDYLTELRPKLYAIPEERIPERFIRDQYVEGAQIFNLTEGLYAIPFAVDPLVMYWNRDIFSSNEIAVAPKTWEEIRNDTTPRLTRTGGTYDILQSAVAFGEFQNVRRAKEIISLLMIQSGSLMVVDGTNGYSVNLNQLPQGVSGTDPATSAVNFYTQFANPASSLYSWNRSLPEDRSRFLSGELALYFDYGSELIELENANPNLNFDMAEVPQGQTASTRRGYGRFYGLAIPLAARDQASSYVVAQKLGSQEISTKLAELHHMAPVYREAVAATEIDPFQTIRNKAAIIARAWLEPNPLATKDAFRLMIEDVTSGRQSVGAAIGDAVQRIKLAY